MSLYKQLWLLTTLLLTLVFAGVFIVSSLAAKDYLEQQLYIKNSDNANALALSLTQQNADLVLAELTLAAQFDTGHYELIALQDPSGKTVLERRSTLAAGDAPAWFTRLLPIDVEPTATKIQHGWQQTGTLILQSHSRFAYKALWESTLQQAMIFVIGLVLSGLLGSYLLKVILRPMNDVVDQAVAISQRRFVSIDEPSTHELKTVVRSMNTLSKRVKTMLDTQAQKLEAMRREHHTDKVTGLPLREPFLDLLGAVLKREDASASGGLSIIHISDMTALNKRHGRAVLDEILASFGAGISTLVAEHPDWAGGRLNGSDFALLAPRVTDPADLGRLFQATLSATLESKGMIKNVKLAGASTLYEQGDQPFELLTTLDTTVRGFEQESESRMGVAKPLETVDSGIDNRLMTWSKALETGFRDDQFSLARYPMTTLQGELIYLEAPARLHHGNDIIPAGQFLPWINRLEQAAELDKRVVLLALGSIERDTRPMCIKLSHGALGDSDFQQWLAGLLAAHPESAAQLHVEVQEVIVYRHLERFRQLCVLMKGLDVKIGMGNMGHKLASLGELHDMGLDFIAIDQAFIRGIDTNATNQTLVRTLAALGHSLGAAIYTQGVNSPQEWLMLQSLGIDGATGPEITRQGNSA